ncbi:nucleoside triphosphate pyrophosphohydrolase [Candidatus Berkiella aquae]|uniref:Nucleoside triphosphate pyrophosphohydrolase n=1 Tax=Candidatus Berkiella aquae TaxID=295108 RepID=A0A0Q9YKT4_9GAMM|nr:nucleoside triphosphate pyrophosphohydrolase [Candidatus Berkiella aquae]MCS5711101.1 nucleoside triphosphate pyrophosphohydrolase [Candidatus Berkiella aquae]
MNNNPTTLLQELLDIMAKLRSKDEGCAWDRAQTFKTIVPHTIEEAYEVADVIERNALAELPSELGDLFYQILFYCQMAKEEQRFSLTEVLAALKEKLIRRHPHVFNNEQPKAWDEIKKQEKPDAPLLGSIPSHFPALSMAQKLQNRAATVGFDWPNLHPVLAKLQEEIKEFEEAFANHDQAAMSEELGDILFVCANLARHAKLDAEQVLRLANQKFTRRFQGVEEQVKASGKAWDAFSLEELETFWHVVKKTEKIRN